MDLQIDHLSYDAGVGVGGPGCCSRRPAVVGAGLLPLLLLLLPQQPLQVEQALRLEHGSVTSCTFY